MRPSHAGYFHVAARSNAEEQIFRDHRDYHAGIQILAELATARLFRCFGFCFMPTHYHLFAWFDDGMLAPAIHKMNRRYASGFNRRHARRGKVFDHPFAVREVRTEAHFARVPEYIAENPSSRPWPWSSYDAEFSFVETLELSSPAAN